LDIFSIIPYFVLSALYLLLGRVVIHFSGFFRRPIPTHSGDRFAAVDGLRGFLAMGVFFSHCIQHYWYARSGNWGNAPTGFYTMTGQVGVALFFQITAFLFWGKVLKSDGHLDTAVLYSGRVRRLVPMYLVSVLLVFVVVAAESDFALQTGLKDVVKQARGWLAFGFLETAEFNGLRDAHVINAVYWTLAFEWAFYLALPMLGLFVKPWKFAVLTLIALVYGMRTPIVLNFLCGAVAATIVYRYRLREMLGRRIAAVVPVAALTMIFFFFDSAYGVPQSLLLLLFFVFIVHGNDLCGLLASKGARFLGEISYSIYLLHGIVLYVILRVIGKVAPIAAIQDVAYWSVVGAGGGITILLAAFTYRHIEFRFIRAHVLTASTAT